MATEQLTSYQLAERLGTTREAARRVPHRWRRLGRPPFALHPLDLLLGLGHALLALGRAADANGLMWTYLP